MDRTAMKILNPRLRFLVLFLIPALLAACSMDSEEGSPTFPPAFEISLSGFATGLSSPVGITNSGPGDDRLYVIEKAGVIKIVPPDGIPLATSFLDITDLVDDDGEGGLLGLAFHPNYPTEPYFYVNYTHSVTNGRKTRISRFSILDADTADEGSETVLLTVPQEPFTNHKAGDIHFGPDGYLYIPLGDGGGGGDPGENAQDKTTLLGKIARIDVDSDPGGDPPDCKGLGAGGYTVPSTNPFSGGPGDDCDEIWAVGFRNPWRSSFDRLTGDLYIADVGQNSWEEINFQPAGSAGGQNYGWDCYEGNHSFETCIPQEDYTFPIFEYSHADDECTVIGGYVYRGTAHPVMEGHYIFMDFCTGHFWDAVSNGAEGWRVAKHDYLEEPFSFVSFGEDSDGELYAVSIGGTIYRVQAN
jgi:glucose/arabinose dehydrogenase